MQGVSMKYLNSKRYSIPSLFNLKRSSAASMSLVARAQTRKRLQNYANLIKIKASLNKSSKHSMTKRGRERRKRERMKDQRSKWIIISAFRHRLMHLLVILVDKRGNSRACSIWNLIIEVRTARREKYSKMSRMNRVKMNKSMMN